MSHDCFVPFPLEVVGKDFRQGTLVFDDEDARLSHTHTYLSGRGIQNPGFGHFTTPPLRRPPAGAARWPLRPDTPRLRRCSWRGPRFAPNGGWLKTATALVPPCRATASSTESTRR